MDDAAPLRDDTKESSQSKIKLRLSENDHRHHIDKNFQCYYGDANNFKFKNGVNIIIGENEQGNLNFGTHSIGCFGTKSFSRISADSSLPKSTASIFLDEGESRTEVGAI